MSVQEPATNQVGPVAPPSLAALLRDATRRLVDAGVEEAATDARLLLRAATGLDRTALLLRGDDPVALDAAERFAGMIARRAAREPVHRILGEREFYGLPFRLGPDTLEPRPDSETLIDAVLDHVRGGRPARRVLDLGTGTGCLLLAVLSHLPGAWGVGIDRAEGAVRLARDNARRLGQASRTGFLVGDWARSTASLFDLVLCNPPYIASGELADLAPEVRGFDPPAALDGGADGLASYRVIMRMLPGLLTPSGLAVLEIGAGQAEAVCAIIAAAGLQVIEVRRDLAGLPRVIVVDDGKKPVGTEQDRD